MTPAITALADFFISDFSTPGKIYNKKYNKNKGKQTRIHWVARIYGFGIIFLIFLFLFFPFSGSESPAAFVDKDPLTGSLAARQAESERYREMAKKLNLPGAGTDKQLSNEISAPYEVPQYPIEQIETKLIRWLFILIKKTVLKTQF